MKHARNLRFASHGITLLEVVLAIVVFAVGMLALVQLQSGVARSGADASTRTVAANLAERIIEDAKGFRQVFAADNGRTDYAEIVSYAAPQTVVVGDPDIGTGVEYLVDLEVTDYYYSPDPDDPAATPFVTEKPVGVVTSDFKVLELTITWNAVGQLTDLGSGDLTVREIIQSTPSLIGANIASENDGSLGGPEVPFTPGVNPDIVALQLDDLGTRFKESTSPQPDVLRGDFTQTWFDVVTYSQVDGSNVFLRREEFVAVACDCDLYQDGLGGGLRPTLWNGFEYTEGAYVPGKEYGVRASGSPDSLYCDVCCRDHHDGGSSDTENLYKPAVYSGAGNHPHYGRDHKGELKLEPATPATGGSDSGTANDYVEACRLVRKDGYMRVTQDAVQQGLFGFPEEYLVFVENVEEYSDYVIEAVSGYYPAQSDFDQPEDVAPKYVIPASTPETATDLPTVYFTNSQQLRSRGVYTDYLTAEAKTTIANCFDDKGDPLADLSNCPVKYATSPLELYPFFDLQLTWLNRWNEEPTGEPIEVSNEPVESNNSHSRGLATLVDPSVGGQTKVLITSQRDNLGLTATEAIDKTYVSQSAVQPLYIDANLDNTPGTDVGVVVAGPLTSGVKNVRAADLALSGDGALCGQTDVAYSCLVKSAGATITVGNYIKKNTALWACSDLGDPVSTVPNDTDGGTLEATFALPLGAADGLGIWIQDSECEASP